jgi:tetratricopeptide (TPR) repeat protein
MKNIGLVVGVLIPAMLGLLQPGHGQATRSSPTPAEQKISWAQAEIKAGPKRAQSYNDLAVGYVSRARESGDARYYDQAAAVLKISATTDPDNFEMQKTQVRLLLGRHEYAQALLLARTLNKRTPDDILTYGLMADASSELGDYPEAEKSTQWMLDLRPGNIPGLLRAARLRQLYGDTEGALDFYSQAYQQFPPTQIEDLAWTLTQMANIRLSTGHLDEAEGLLHSALEKFPGYYLTLDALASLEIARQHYSAAVELLCRRNQNFPTPASRYALAEALELAGRRTDANTEYGEFEALARTQVNAADNANRELVLYYLHGNKPLQALRIAEIEASRRHDILTRDAYAWALNASGRSKEARQQIDLALGVGARNAELLYHAGIIAESLQDHIASARYLRESLDVNPSSDVSIKAGQVLQKIVAPPLPASGGK